MEAQKSTLTCAKSLLAVGLIYAPSGALGRGPLSLRTEFFRSPLPPLIAGLLGVVMILGVASGVLPFCRLIAESSDEDFLFPDRPLNLEDVDAIFERDL